MPCPHLPEATRSGFLQLILRHASHFNFVGSAVFNQSSLQVKAAVNEAVVVVIKQKFIYRRAPVRLVLITHTLAGSSSPSMLSKLSTTMHAIPWPYVSAQPVAFLQLPVSRNIEMMRIFPYPENHCRKISKPTFQHTCCDLFVTHRRRPF